MYELEIITDIASVDKKGKVKVVTKNDKIKRLFDLNEIELEEYIDNRTGRHIKKYTSVFHNNTYLKINKPYEELKDIVMNRSIPVLGFAYKSRRYK